MIVLPAPGSSASRKRSGVRGKELAVDRAQLVGQRLDVRGRDREHRVGQAGELDPLALGDELEVGGESVERTRLDLGDRELLSASRPRTRCSSLPSRI
jgi:hypothetical protein